MGSMCQYSDKPKGDVDLKAQNIIKPNMSLNNKILNKKIEEKNINKESSFRPSILGNNDYSKAKSMIPKERESEYLSKNDYNKRVFDLINNIRMNPAEYSKVILENIKNIIYETHLVQNEETGEEEDTRICIFKKKVKVALNKGESSFQEAAKILENTPSMDAFKFREKIVIPLPNNEEEFLDHKFINNKAHEIMKKYKINFFFQEYIKNPEVAVLMMIVNDTNNMTGTKRNYILNKDLRYIGINSKFIGKNFIAFFSFSK